MEDIRDAANSGHLPQSRPAEDDASDANLSLILNSLRRTGGYVIPAFLVALCLSSVFLFIVYSFLPVSSTYSARVQITFPESRLSRYPNGAPFALNEIIAPTVLSEVYDRLRLADAAISRDEFYSGFSVRPYAVLYQEISDRYREQFNNNKLSVVEREQLEKQFSEALDRASRDGAEVTWNVRRHLPISRETALNVVATIPAVWSELAIERKGALKPASFNNEAKLVEEESLKSASLPWATIELLEAANRLNGRLASLTGIPGVATWIDHETGMNLLDMRAHFRNLVIFKLNTLLNVSLRSFDLGSERGLLDAMIVSHIQDLGREIEREQGLSQAISDSMRSFVDATSSASSRSPEQNVANAGGTIAQVTDSFVDRIIGLSKNPQREAFIADSTNRQLAVAQRIPILKEEAAQWAQLLEWVRADNKTLSLNDPLYSRLSNAVAPLGTELNATWKKLNDLQVQYVKDASGDYGGQLYVPLEVRELSGYPFFFIRALVAAVTFTLFVTLAVWLAAAAHNYWNAVLRKQRGTAVGYASMNPAE